MLDSFKCKEQKEIDGTVYNFYNLKKLKTEHLPLTVKILLENLLRKEDGVVVSKDDIAKLIDWKPEKKYQDEIAFTPARVILQDFTGVPAVVDLAAMRDAMVNLSDDPQKINPLSPVDLVIDHSVMVDYYNSKDAYAKNTAVEVTRNKERYQFLRWGQKAFNNFRVVPPGTGIVHQVNLEYLAQVIFVNEVDGQKFAYPDTLVGTDSHTTMINGLGVLGWGVGGIEAEAAMLGQPVTMLIPEVIGFEIKGELGQGVTATDLVLTITEILRKHKVVGKFVEFYGEGVKNLSLADRATIANMAPEYGATCGLFPIDDETLRYLKASGRSDEHVSFVKQLVDSIGIFSNGKSSAKYSENLTLDLKSIEPCIAGPKRPQDKILLRNTKFQFLESLKEQGVDPRKKVKVKNSNYELTTGDVVIAAITSCTNTSNPDVMLAAGLLARKANSLGLKTKPWVKTSLAPGSKVVTDYLKKANLLEDLEKLGFYVVGYGCTTCIGNSGPLNPEISEAIQSEGLITCAVLSGNRNFEGRIHPEVKNSYLASPPLVVLYALLGTMNIDPMKDIIGKDQNGKDVTFADIWPTNEEIRSLADRVLDKNMFNKEYSSVFEGDENWSSLKFEENEVYQWDDASTYIKNPPYFENMTKTVVKRANINEAHVLALLGDSITTDHISPAGSISKNSPAGKYLIEQGVTPADFNSYGSRRGNHEVMLRGTFANIRLRNKLVPNSEGSWTKHFPSGKEMSIYDAAMDYQHENRDLIVLAGSEYGTGSSRDWAAKGTALLGVKAVIAKSFERIHRSNLIGMGVLPLEFMSGEDAEVLNIRGDEKFSIVVDNLKPQQKIVVKVMNGELTHEFLVKARIDTPKELEYYQHGGILHYVLRQLVK